MVVGVGVEVLVVVVVVVVMRLVSSDNGRGAGLWDALVWAQLLPSSKKGRDSGPVHGVIFVLSSLLWESPTQPSCKLHGRPPFTQMGW